jgi:hypothetical protein
MMCTNNPLTTTPKPAKQTLAIVLAVILGACAVLLTGCANTMGTLSAQFHPDASDGTGLPPRVARKLYGVCGAKACTYANYGDDQCPLCLAVQKYNRKMAGASASQKAEAARNGLPPRLGMPDQRRAYQNPRYQRRPSTSSYQGQDDPYAPYVPTSAYEAQNYEAQTPRVNVRVLQAPRVPQFPHSFASSEDYVPPAEKPHRTEHYDPYEVYANMFGDRS